MSGRPPTAVGAILVIILLVTTQPFETPPGEGGSSGRTETLLRLIAHTVRAEEAPPEEARASRAVSKESQGPSRSPASTPARFFFAGSGRLVLRHAYFDTTLDVRYRHADGSYDLDALRQIAHFFRSREDNREAPITLRLIELLAYIQAQFHSRQMILLSGFRSPEFNADLRQSGRQVAQASLHTEAMAADVLFTGVDMAGLWHQLRARAVGGVGYYRQNKFLHIDTGPPRFWEAHTSRVDENLSAENARVFLRTDFDRYPTIAGAICSLHSLTAFPIFISAKADLVGATRTTRLTLQPVDGRVATDAGCFAVNADAESHRFRVVHAESALPEGRVASAHVVFSTCEPRIGKTPAQITSNPIEVP